MRYNTILWQTICVLMLLAMMTPVLAQASENEGIDPKAAAILDKYVEVTGGTKAYEKVDNRYIVGSLEMPAMGISFNLEMWMAKPDKYYQLGKSEGLGEIESGSDGEVFWESSMMTGPRIYEGGELDQYELLMWFDRYAYWREVYDSAAYVGEDSVGGALCDKLMMTAWNGKKETFYFDKKSGLLVRLEAVIETQMGNVPVDTYFEDYRRADGISMPFVTSQKFMGQTMVTRYDSVEQNVEIADSIFALPPKILDLIETRDSTDTE